MSDDALLEAVHVLNPRTLERARRLAVALVLLRGGMSRADAMVAIRLRFTIDRFEAWRLVDMAADIAGPK